jgi:(p)ppGpp synthase/HD superfamily hydrolase
MQLSPRFRDALIYADQLHSTQVRKGKPIPYISHLMAVCSIVLEKGGTEDQAIAALLHDAVEDQGGKPTLEQIRGMFGEDVARIVSGCTDADTIPKPAWRPRKEAYLRHLREVPADVRLVSAADKLHNARSILSDYRELGQEVWQRFKGGQEGTLWYYHELVGIFSELGPQSLAEELKRVIDQLDSLLNENHRFYQEKLP